MVEAAGVEPASESTVPKDSTCLSILDNLTSGVKARQKPPEASPDESCYHASVPHVVASPLNGV